MFWVFKLSFFVDILAFLTWQLFGLFFKRFGEFFFLSYGHSAFIPGMQILIAQHRDAGLTRRFAQSYKTFLESNLRHTD